MAASSESDRLQTLSKLGLIMVSIGLVITILGGWFAASRPVAAIDQSKLDNYTESLTSYTHESLLLAQQYRHKRAPANYTAVSAEKMYVAVSDLRLELQTGTPIPGLEVQVDRRASEATDLAEILSKLARTADNGTAGNFSEPLQNILKDLAKS